MLSSLQFSVFQIFNHFFHIIYHRLHKCLVDELPHDRGKRFVAGQEHNWKVKQNETDEQRPQNLGNLCQNINDIILSMKTLLYHQ